MMNRRIRQTTIDYTGFIKLRDRESQKIEAAKCKKCNKILQTITDSRLQAHRRTCEKKDDPDITDNDLQENVFYSEGMAFVKVENHYFLRYTKNLGKFNIDYKPPDRRALATTILKRIYDEISQEKKMIEGTDGVLLVDGWKNTSTNRKYLVFSIKNVNVHLFFLTYVDISVETEHADKVQIHINKAIKLAWDEYRCYIYAILTDNDPKIVKAGELAKTVDGKNLFQSTCCSHSGNLFINVFTDKDLLSLISEIVTAFRQTKMDALLIRKNGTKLQNYPDTRFCYLRDSCLSIFKNLTKLRELTNVADVPLSDAIKARIQSKDFETLLKTVIDNLDPVCQLINACQDPTLNIADTTEMWITLKMPTNEYNTQIADRISKALRPVNFAANLMHPRYNGENLNEIQREMTENYLSEYFSVDAQKEFALYNLNRQKYAKFGQFCGDPVYYWKILKLSLPTLSKETLRLQLIPASTATLEGLFSQWTYVHSCYRNRLGDHKSSELVDMYNVLKSKYFHGEIIEELKKLEQDGEEIRW